MTKRSSGRMVRPTLPARPGQPPGDVFRAFVRTLERLDPTERRPSGARSGGEGQR